MHEQRARVQASRKRQENDGIAEEVATRKRIKGKETMARALQRKAMDRAGASEP